MNKIYISVTAISLLLGVVHAFAVKASNSMTYWTTVNIHHVRSLGEVMLFCQAGNRTICAVQYFNTGERTGQVKLTSYP